MPLRLVALRAEIKALDGEATVRKRVDDAVVIRTECLDEITKALPGLGLNRLGINRVSSNFGEVYDIVAKLVEDRRSEMFTQKVFGWSDRDDFVTVVRTHGGAFSVTAIYDATPAIVDLHEVERNLGRYSRSCASNAPHPGATVTFYCSSRKGGGSLNLTGVPFGDVLEMNEAYNVLARAGCLAKDFREDERQLSARATSRERHAKICIVTDACPSHPESGTHECLQTEMRCAYCGERLAPYPCNGCGKFLNAKQMHAASADGENWRCERCE